MAMSGAQAGPSSNRKQHKPGDVSASVGQPDVSLKSTFSKDCTLNIFHDVATIARCSHGCCAFANETQEV